MAGQCPLESPHWLHTTHFNDPMLSDLTLKLSDGTIFHAHRVVLCRRSKYFDKLITGGFTETNLKEITLHDEKPVAVLAMLRFLYGLPYEEDKAHWHDGKTILPHAEVYTVAEKYEIENLKAQVYKNMVNLISLAGDKPDLVDTLREIMTHTPDTDAMARRLLVDHYVDCLPTLSQHDNFIALLEECGALGAAVITSWTARLRGI